MPSLYEKRKAVYENFVANLGSYTGEQIEDSNGIVYDDPSDIFTEVYFVQAPRRAETIRKELVVRFQSDSEIIVSAILDGEPIKEAQGFSQL